MKYPTAIICDAHGTISHGGCEASRGLGDYCAQRQAALVPLPPEGERQIILTTKDEEWPEWVYEAGDHRWDDVTTGILDALAEGEDSP